MRYVTCRITSIDKLVDRKRSFKPVFHDVGDAANLQKVGHYTSAFTFWR